MHVLPSSVAIWVSITNKAAWDRHLSCHTAHLKGCCVFHTFLKGKLFSSVAYTYLTAVIKYMMLMSHPIWPFWKCPISFFKEHNRSLRVKPKVTASAGDVQQATTDLTKGMSSVPLQHLTVSPPKERANPEQTNAFYHLQEDLFFTSVPSLLHNHCSFAFRVCFGGHFL